MNFRNQNFVFWGSLFLSLALSLGGCKKADSSTSDEESVQDATSNAVDSSVSEANSQAASIEGGSLSLQGIEDEFEIQPFAVCTYTSIRDTSTCAASSTATVDYGGCTIGTASATGRITETYTGTGATSCSLGADASTLRRVISTTSPKVITFASGATLTVTTSPSTPWDSSSVASTGTVITRTESGTSNGQTCAAGTSACYRVVVSGMQKVLKGPRGRTWFDHIITADLTKKGTRAGQTRVVTGSATVWHQVAKYKAVSTFTTVTWGDSTCRYPTSGSISTAFTGSLTGTATTTFTTTCGVATFVGTDGTSSSVTLTQSE